jgi:hypothetical protein
MDTRLKKTPLPTPSLLFLNKNFSDGTHETHDISENAPTFGSLGLENDFEPESIGQSLTELRLHEKQLQRKVRILIFYFHIYHHLLLIASSICLISV